MLITVGIPLGNIRCISETWLDGIISIMHWCDENLLDPAYLVCVQEEGSKNNFRFMINSEYKSRRDSLVQILRPRDLGTLHAPNGSGICGFTTFELSEEDSVMFKIRWGFYPNHQNYRLFSEA